MRIQLIVVSIISSALILFAACHSAKVATAKKTDTNTSVVAPKVAKVTGPPMIIYKTIGNYNDFVPVTLSEDGNSIVSYPAPSDLKVGEELMQPTPLKDGFLIDNRGINEHTAFTNIPYTEYAGMKEAPKLEELMNRIVDKHPFQLMFVCGVKSSYGSSSQELIIKANQMIDNGTIYQACKCSKPKANIQVVPKQ